MAETPTPAQFKDAAKESLRGHKQDLAHMQEAAADANEDLKMRKKTQLRASRDVEKRKESRAQRKQKTKR